MHDLHSGLFLRFRRFLVDNFTWRDDTVVEHANEWSKLWCEEKKKKLRPRCNDLQIIVLHLKLFLCTFARNMACMYKRNRDRQQAKPGRLWSSRFQEWDLCEYVSFIPIFMPKCQPLPGKLPPSITEFDSESKRCFNRTAHTRSKPPSAKYNKKCPSQKYPPTSTLPLQSAAL